MFDHLFIIEKEKPRVGVSDNTLVYALQTQEPIKFTSDCTESLKDTKKIMEHKKLFTNLAQYNRYTKVISEIQKSMNIDFNPMTRLKM